MGAPVLRNHAGRPSSPVAQGRSVSKTQNILYSSMYFSSEFPTGSFSSGVTGAVGMFLSYNAARNGELFIQ